MASRRSKICIFICVQSKRASASDDTSNVGAHTLAVRPFKPSATTRSPRTASSCSNTRGRRVRRECTGIFRGQGIGIAKAIVSLTLFHEGRIFITNQFKQHNLKKLEP